MSARANPPSADNGWLRSNAHRLAPLSVLALGVFGVAESRRLGLGELTAPGPGLWPLVLAFVVTIAATVLLFVDDRADYESWSRRTVTIVAALVGLAGYIVAFTFLGFAISTVLMLAIWLRVFARESWKSTILLTVVGTATLYLVFDLLLNVPFPEGVLLIGLGDSA